MKKWMIMSALMCVAAMPAMAMSDMSDRERANSHSQKMFDKADTDHDGVLTRTENNRYADQMFMKADANHDDRLTREEHHVYKMQRHDKYDKHASYKNRKDKPMRDMR